jgi:hypothetical protein
MGSLIEIIDAFCANAHCLIRLVASGARAPIRSQALEEGVVLVYVTAGIKRRDSTRIVAKGFEVRNETSYCGGCAQGCDNQDCERTRASGNTSHLNLCLKFARLAISRGKMFWTRCASGNRMQVSELDS